MNTPVYAEQITSLSDARYFSGMGVRWLGICVDPDHPRFLPAARFREIAGWVSGPQFVLEADTLAPDFNAAALAEEYGVSFFRINPQQIGAVKNYPFGLILTDKLNAPGHTSIINYQTIPDKTEFLIFSSGEIPPLSLKDKITILPSPDTAEEAARMLNSNPETGFLIKGSDEQEPGLKNYDSRDLLEFLDSLS
jgi:phosphoribosylanthranilate isomerase